MLPLLARRIVSCCIGYGRSLLVRSRRKTSFGALTLLTDVKNVPSLLFKHHPRSSKRPSHVRSLSFIYSLLLLVMKREFSYTLEDASPNGTFNTFLYESVLGGLGS